jgi:hypothetical protein
MVCPIGPSRARPPLPPGARLQAAFPIPRLPSGTALVAAPTAAVQAALEAARALADRVDSPAKWRAYQADWAYYAAWCADKGFAPVPAHSEIVGAYLASLAETHAPTTIRRRLSAIGRTHHFNDLPWNPAHRDIQAPLLIFLPRFSGSIRASVGA